MLSLENVSYRYQKDSKDVISNVNYKFENGYMYAIVGKSGAGKTTLLSLLAGLIKPITGNILLDELNLNSIDTYEYRSKKIGVIFQSYNLLPKFSALENVILSMDIAKIKNVDKKQRAKELLFKVGLSDEEINRKILKLSGGQQQRVAIARCLAYDPQIILADEPTGNLDEETQAEIITILKKLAHDENRCVIIVTHSPVVAEMSDKIYRLG